MRKYNQSMLDRNIARNVRQYGSPVYTTPISALAPGTSEGISVDRIWPASRRYKPLTTLEVVNNDVIDLRIIVNGNTTLYVPHNSTKSWDNLPLYELIITNMDTIVTITANTIFLSLHRPPVDADQVLRERYG